MKRLLLVPLLIVAGLLTGCTRQHWLAVEPGLYTEVWGTDAASRAAALPAK